MSDLQILQTVPDVVQAKVYKTGRQWTWYHQGCNADPVTWRRTWWGATHDDWDKAIEAALRHMERDHGIGTRV